MALQVVPKYFTQVRYMGTISCPQVFYSERGIHWHYKLSPSILLRWDILALYVVPKYFIQNVGYIGTIYVVPKYFTQVGYIGTIYVVPKYFTQVGYIGTIYVVPKYFTQVGYIGTISWPQVFYSKRGIHWHYKLSPSILLRT